jgi:hypothetical protein
MLRREGDMIFFEDTRSIQEQAGWVLPDMLTPAQAVETGASMLEDAHEVADSRLQRAEAGLLEHDEAYYAEQAKIDALRRAAQLIFAACPVEREQFVVEQQTRDRFLKTLDADIKR